jgi:hypothetical protein
VRPLNAPVEIWRAGAGYLDPIAAVNSRTPSGHPEGYLEAFANIYAAFYKAVRAVEIDPSADYRRFDFPNVDDGVRGMTFVDTAVRSAQSETKWTTFP